MDFEDGILYRLCYGLAHQLREARRFDAQYNRHRNNAAAGGDVAEVVKQLGLEDRRSGSWPGRRSRGGGRGGDGAGRALSD